MPATLQDIVKKARKKMSENNKRRTVKPGEGKSIWRILPGWDSANPAQFFREYGQHYIKNREGKLQAVVVCPDKTFGEACPICDMVREAATNAPDDATREAILESRSSQRYLLNAIQVDKKSDEVEILEVGQSILTQLFESIDEYDDLIDPEKGNDLIISREGKGLQTKYTITVRSREKSKPVAQSVLAKMHDLEAYVTEDFAAKSKKALEVLGTSFGNLTGGGVTAAALTGPSPEIEADLADDAAFLNGDTEIEGADLSFDDESVEDAEIVTESEEKAESSIDDFETDDELDALLADLDS